MPPISDIDLGKRFMNCFEHNEMVRFFIDMYKNFVR